MGYERVRRRERQREVRGGDVGGAAGSWTGDEWQGGTQQQPPCCCWLTAAPPESLTGALPGPPAAGALAAVLCGGRSLCVSYPSAREETALEVTHRSLICFAMVKKACSTLVAFLADVSRSETPIWSANSLATA